MSKTGAAVRLREISHADVPAIARLLNEGFPAHSMDYWLRGLHRMGDRPQSGGYPKYGYLLQNGDVAVGVILLFFSREPSGSSFIVRCNVSSWYVRPEFRVFASLLITSITRDPSITYFNISAVRETWPTVEAQGFSVYCRGQMYAFAFMRRPIETVRIEVLDSAKPDPGTPHHEILRQHAAVGCLSVNVQHNNGCYPFVFQRHYLKRIVPVYRLTYCRDIDDFVRFAGNLGHFLLRRGSLLVQLDANQFMSGLTGWYSAKRGRKYCKGPNPPRLGDLSFTETAFFDS